MNSRLPLIHGVTAVQEMLCCCARMVIEPACADRITRLASQDLDWLQLLQFAKEQQVRPLLRRSLNKVCPDSVPPEILQRLHDHYYGNAGRGLFIADELNKLIGSIESAGAAVIPYKGIVLAKHLYGEAGLREFGDIDLLVRPRGLAKATEAVIAAGYSPKGFHGDTERHFVSQDERVSLDLHWQCFRCVGSYFNPDRWWDRCRRESLFGSELTCFPDEELLLILCVNATKECWKQSLHSLCDIAELIRARDEMDWGYIASEARKLRLTRMMLAAISLAQQLLGAQPPKEIQQQIDRDLSLRSLTDTLRGRLLPQSPSKPDRWIIYRWDLAKMEHRSEKMVYLTRVLGSYLKPSQMDREFIQLPKVLSPLYYAVRPVRVVASLVKGSKRR